MKTNGLIENLVLKHKDKRSYFEAGFWLFLILAIFISNSIVAVIDAEDSGVQMWEPIAWEGTSLLAVLLLIPFIVWYSKLFPLYWGNLRKALLAHLAGTVIFAIAHVTLMVGLRSIIYFLNGQHYQFGTLPFAFFYEYVKDVRTYFEILIVVEGYRFIIRRIQGEASLPEQESPPDNPNSTTKRFLVKMLGKEFLLDANSISSASASGNYVNLKVDNREYPLRITMKELEQELAGYNMVRVHRSHLVRLDHIESIEPLESGDARISLKTGDSIPCSRRYLAALRESVS